jgi:3-dehydroquinate synthase class II
MLRRFIAAVVVLVICIGVIVAAEFKAKVTKVDADKNTVFVRQEGKEKDRKIVVKEDIKVVDADGKPLKVESLKEGDEVTVTFERKEVDGKKRQIIKEIKKNK